MYEFVPKIRVTVDLPQPLRLDDGRDRLSLLVGPGQEWVEVDGAGMVTVHRGGAVLYGINVLTAARLVAEANTRLAQSAADRDVASS